MTHEQNPEAQPKPTEPTLEFFASGWASGTAWMMLGFWLLFFGFWLHEAAQGGANRIVLAWTFAGMVGLVLQGVRVRSLKRAQVRLASSELWALDLWGRPVAYDLATARSASLFRRRTSATLVLRFQEKGRTLRRWVYSVDELEEPKLFIAELVARLPGAAIDGSVKRYLEEDVQSLGGQNR